MQIEPVDFMNNYESLCKIEKSFCKQFAPCNNCPCYDPTDRNEGDFKCMFTIIRLNMVKGMKE